MAYTPRAMRRASSTILRGALCVALALAACRREERVTRCARCGMAVPASSHWAAGAVTAGGRALSFDTPGCMFRQRAADPSLRDARLWVTPYYARAGVHEDARGLVYAAGSNVRGPMGADLIPLRAFEAATFTRDHRARRVLRFDEVTPEALQALSF